MATKIIFDGENFVSDNKNGFKVVSIYTTLKGKKKAIIECTCGGRIKMTLNDAIETIDFYDECPHIGVKRK